MKYFLLIPFIVTTFSCTSYHYLKLESTDLTRNKESGFTESNDSLEINYSFNGNNGPLHLTVYNRMDKGLQLDLSRSALVLNGQAVSLFSGDIQMKGITHGNSVQWARGISSSSGIISASGRMQQSMLFIPSHAYIDITPIKLTNQFFDSIPDSKFVKSFFCNFTDPVSRQIKTADFGQDESPLSFKTYLTFMLTEPGQKEFVKEHSFYVAEIIKAPFRPGDFDYMKSPNGDKFYVSQTKGTGVGAGLVVATIVAAAAVAHTGSGNGK